MLGIGICPWKGTTVETFVLGISARRQPRRAARSAARTGRRENPSTVVFHRGGVPRHHVSKKNGAESRFDPPAAPRGAGRSNRLSCKWIKPLQKGCVFSARVEGTRSCSKIFFRACSPLAATDGVRRGPRLAQGAQKTLRLGCLSRDLYQCPTYQLYMHIRHLWRAPRRKNHSAVHLVGFLSTSREQWGASCAITRIFEKTMLRSHFQRRLVRNGLRGRSPDVQNAHERSPETSMMGLF